MCLMQWNKNTGPLSAILAGGILRLCRRVLRVTAVDFEEPMVFCQIYEWVEPVDGLMGGGWMDVDTTP